MSRCSLLSKTIVCIGISFVFIKCTNPFAKKEKLDTNDKKALYSLGSAFGKKINNLELTKTELKYLFAGLQDHLEDRLRYDTKTSSQLMQNFINRRLVSQSAVRKEKGDTYLKKMLTEGFQKTASGLAYKITRPGTKVRANISDSVHINYEGKLIDGSVFETNYGDKEKLIIPLSATIKGWREGLKLIGERGEIELIVPSDLGYGNEGSLPKVPGGATLHFKVSLYKIHSMNLSSRQK